MLDTNGKPYLRADQASPGTIVDLDAGFGCIQGEPTSHDHVMDLLRTLRTSHPYPADPRVNYGDDE